MSARSATTAVPITTRTSWVVAVLIAIVVLAMLAVAAPQIWYPLWFDQGAFAACADVLRRGGVMYRDCWDARGPLTPMLYALPLTIAPTQIALQLFNLAWQAMTTALVALLARRLFHHWLPVLAASGLFWLMNASLNYWSLAQAEGFANVFFLAAALSAWMGRRRTLATSATSATSWVWFASSGVFAGALFWLKYPFAIFALVLAIWVLIDRPTWAGLRQSALLLFGAALAMLAGLVYFVLGGAWMDVLTHVQYAITTFHNTPLTERWAWLTGVFWIELTTFARVGSTPTAGFKVTVPQVEILGRGYPFIMMLIAPGAGRLLLSKDRQPAGALLLLWLIAVIGLNIWQGHLYRYHFIIWLAPMALLVGAACLPRPTRATSALASVWAAVSLALAALAATGLIAAMLPWMRDAYDNVIVQRKSPATLYLESNEAPYVRLADFLRANSRPDERIAVFSDAPLVYFLAQRPNATRFPYLRWAEEARDPVVKAQLTNQFFAELVRNSPRFFILTQDGFPWPSARFVDLQKRMPNVRRYVEANYQFAGENGPFLLFERKRNQR